LEAVPREEEKEGENAEKLRAGKKDQDRINSEKKAASNKVIRP